MEHEKNYAIRNVDPAKDPRWDSFIETHPESMVYHHSAWAEVIASTYGHNPFYVILEDPWSARLEGAAPFFIVESLFTGKRVVSLPLTSYCRPLIPHSELPNIITYIAAQVEGLHSIKIKTISKDSSRSGCSSFVSHFLDLRPRLYDISRSLHPVSVMERIQAAELSGMTFRLGRNEDDMKEFYGLLTADRGRRGLPPQPYSFYSNMWNILYPRKLMFLALVEKNGKAAAGAVVLKSRNIYHYEYEGLDPEQAELMPGYKLLWDIIKLSHSEGAHYLDLGRSETENKCLREKMQAWNAVSRSLNYCSFPDCHLGNHKTALGRQGAEAINRHLPHKILQAEGRMIYPHMD